MLVLQAVLIQCVYEWIPECDALLPQAKPAHVTLLRGKNLKIHFLPHLNASGTLLFNVRPLLSVHTEQCHRAELEPHPTPEILIIAFTSNQHQTSCQ